MIKIVDKYRQMSFEEKTLFSTKFSIFSNAFFAITKIIASFFLGIFFLVAGVLNIFVMMSKLECFLGIKYPQKKSFRYRNNMIGLFLVLAGLQYAIYMGRLLYSNVDVMNYDMILGIGIACVSFLELGFAIKGWFVSFGKGHYLRNIKLINLCSAMTAIVLTEIALMSFASETDSRMMDGIFGLVVGIVISLIGGLIFILPKISVVDREHNVYKVKTANEVIEEDDIKIQLTFSKFYANYYYEGKKNKLIIDGHIVRGKSPLRDYHIILKIFGIVLSEILIFPYAVGALVFYFKSSQLIKKLDQEMMKLNYYKILEEETFFNE